MAATKIKFASVLLLLQGILLILFIVFVDYGNEFNPEEESKESFKSKLTEFQNLQVMAFLGFAMIGTFLRRYSRGMLIHAFLIGGLVIQWATLLQGFFTMQQQSKVELSMERMINADYAVLVVLISFGVVIGKVNSLQLVVIAMIETFFFSVNETICFRLLQVTDHGRSIIVHLFGAVFGMAVSRMIYSRRICMSQALSTSNESEIYSFIGTIILWIFWPTLNASNVEGSAQRRAIANTYYSLAASCITTFSLTVFTSRGAFNILHIQNASIAGGVAIGAVAALMVRPWGSIIIGVVGAFSSIMTYRYIVPALRRKLKIHDVRGTNAAHGAPAIVAGVGSVVAAFVATEQMYGTSLYKLYPARAPKVNTTQFEDLMKIDRNFLPGDDRSNYMQGLFQFSGIIVTILISLIAGLLTGLAVRVSFFEPLSVDDAFDDHTDFQEHNCIDICSEDEYEDDHEKHHDSIRGNKRLFDTEDHSDIVANNDTPYAVGQRYDHSTPDSIRKSNLSVGRKSYQSSAPSLSHQSPKISNEKLNVTVTDSSHANTKIHNGMELNETHAHADDETPLVIIKDKEEETTA